MLETILLTGFGPFGAHARNISEEAVRRLDGVEIDGFALRALTLPVQLERAVATLQEAIEAEPPAAILSFGIHDDPTTFRIELSARNERHYASVDRTTGQTVLRPDVDGVVVQDGIVEDGPAMVFSTLPVAAIKQSFESAGLAAELSEDAGRYLCNAIFYWTSRRVTPAGFIHVPAATERLDDAVQAARIAAQVTARRLVAQRVEATA